MATDDVRPIDPRGPRLALSVSPAPDAISQQIAQRRQQKFGEELRMLSEMDSTLARLRGHRNGHALRIRQYARDNHLELDDASLLSASQRSLKSADLALRALSIEPAHYQTAAALRQDLIGRAGYDENHPIVAAATAMWCAWALLYAQETQ